ncbi:MAG: Rho termination factor N-terminal domain-containing protein, partial [Desulfobacterales bacterium]
MSEPTEKTSETQENTAESSAEIQATEANADEAPTEAQESAAPAEEKSEAKSKGEAKEKPLEKMTVKELREIAKDIPGITGVHAMKKEELINGIKEARGIKDEPLKKAVGSLRELKLKIK